MTAQVPFRIRDPLKFDLKQIHSIIECSDLFYKHNQTKERRMNDEEVQHDEKMH